MSIRVIAGSAKGRKLKLVPGDTTRPIMDRVKEALFNIIGRDIYDATFLDLFAGTGSVGIEALSRGAAFALFIDLERKAIQTIQDNLNTTRLIGHAEVRRANAIDMLKLDAPRIFDYIYIAPPQYKSLWKDTLHTLDSHPQWMNETTSIIVQIDPQEIEAIELQSLEVEDQRKYGNTVLWFFRQRAGHPITEE
jgi:16S rRNA (guanine(966)-N(2))-methyltransferase RsmD